MNDERQPMIGYRHELTVDRVTGLSLLLESPVVTAVILGLLPPSYGQTSFIIIVLVGSLLTIVGAVMFSIGRQYVPFYVEPKSVKDER